MSNPVIDRIVKDTERTPAGYPTMPGYTPGGHPATEASQPAHDQWQFTSTTQQAPQAGPVGAPQPQVSQQYPAPAIADSWDAPVEAMTYDDVLVKTATVSGTVFVAGWIGLTLAIANPTIGVALLIGGGLVAFVLSMIQIFKPEPKPALILAYAVAEGLALGGISAYSEQAAPGVVLQALLATAIVFGVTLALFRSGKVRNSPKLQRFTLIGLIGILALQLVNMVLMWTGVTTNPWGLEGATIFGIPLAGLLGIVVVLIGAASLIGDFDMAQRAVRAGAAKKYAWSLAFGITITVVWLYVQILRYLTIIASDRR